MRTWPNLLKTLPLSAVHRTRLAEYIQTNPSVASWRKRHPEAEWFA
jgi:serine/threonine-protein kinase HipA